MTIKTAPILSLIAAATLTLAPRPAGAAEGRIPIPFESPVTYPITIDKEGSYILTRNLMSTGNGPVIQIDVPNGAVSLDLNGMTVKSTDSLTGDVIRVQAALQVAVRNGFLDGGAHGIISGPCETLKVTDVTISNQASFGIIVDGPTSLLEVSHCRLTGSTSGSPVGWGISNRLGFGPLLAARIEGNTLKKYERALWFHGISVGTVIANNAITQCSLSGIMVTNTQGIAIRDNKITDMNEYGIVLQANNQGDLVEGNIIAGATIVGIVSNGPQGNVIRGNQVHPSPNHASGGGITVFGINNIIDGNVVEGLPDWGIRLGCCGIPANNNVYSRNRTVGNTGNPAFCGGRQFMVQGDLCDEGTGNVSGGDNLAPPRATAY